MRFSTPGYIHPQPPPCRAATGSQTGHATAAQVTKLDGIAAGAQVNPTTSPTCQAATASQAGHATAAQITKLDALRRVFQGTYTGDGAADRQITVGAALALAIIADETNLNNFQLFASQVTGAYIQAGITPLIGTVYGLLHATDGFIVETSYGNVNASVYRYIAIERA